MIAVTAAFVLLPGLPLIQVILGTQTLNGVLLPVVLIVLTAALLVTSALGVGS